jgi:RHS repeat-associated protein
VAGQNGAAEPVLAATRFDASTTIDSTWKERDQRGQVVADAEPFYWRQAALPTTRPSVPDFRFAAREYDAFGRERSLLLPNGARKSITYRAFEVTVGWNTLAAGEMARAPVTTRQDGAGRTVQTLRTAAGVVEETEARYDAADRLVQISLQKGQAVHSFQYDTLGLLRVARTPDTGERRMRYDDRSRLARHQNGAGQVIGVFYDAMGRVVARGPRHDFASPALEYDATQRDLGLGKDFVLNYDDPEPGQPNFGNLKGRLAWVLEPAGPVAGLSKVAFGYDIFGRQTMMSRRVAGVPGEEATRYSPSGLVLRQDFDDGFTLSPTYDPAGRLVRLGDVWRVGKAADADSLNGFDASGRVLGETYGNGLQQTYERDTIGLPSRVTVATATGTPPTNLRYGVEVVGRTSFGAPRQVNDLVTGGLDQAARYDYDDASRIVEAVYGSSDATRWGFRYRYDALQNMTGRFQQFPAGTPANRIGVVSGYYEHGGPGYGPRQLSRIIHRDCPGDETTFAYDGAGRLQRQNDIHLSHDGFEQLTQVQRPMGTALVAHGYGFEGLRTYTAGGGTTQQWFSSSYTRRTGATNQRWHYINAGTRLVARLAFQDAVTPLTGGFVKRTRDELEPRLPALVFLIVLMSGALLLAPALRGRRPVRAGVAVATVCALVLAPLGCSVTEPQRRGVELANDRIYFHHGVAAGPVALTNTTGALTDERRFEPFGQLLDGDLAKDPFNSLNKETNLETGWSYHGLRWLAPQTAHWLTPDPAIQVPNVGLLAEPWDLNPYQYVAQNPTIHWDPNGAERFTPDETREIQARSRAATAKYGETEGEKWIRRGITVGLAAPLVGAGSLVAGGLAASAKGLSLFLAIESGADSVQLGLAWYQYYANPNVSSAAGIGIAAADLLSGPHWASDANTIRVLATAPKSPAALVRDWYGQFVLRRKHATYVGSTAPDGRVVLGCSTKGIGCAEDHAQLLAPGSLMTGAMGWRRLEMPDGSKKLLWTDIKVCHRCQLKYTRDQFEPGVKGEPGGAWGDTDE